MVFAGGSRAHDLAVRLKYAGIEAAVIESIEDAFARLGALTAAGVRGRRCRLCYCELHGTASGARRPERHGSRRTRCRPRPDAGPDRRGRRRECRSHLVSS